MPGHTFDLSYVQLFKSLDNLRNKLQPSVCALLRSLGVGMAREWVSQGRPASPRLLFLFLSAPLALRGDGGRRDERKDAKPNRHPPIKRLEHSLEDQIYRILRKAKIITNVASNSLFTSLHTSPPPPPQVLAAECTAYWQAGRQVCEEVSLTGHHCSSRWGLALTLCTKICSRFSLTQDLCISFTGCIRRAPAGGAGGGVAALAVRLRNKIILKHKKLPVSFLVLCDMDASRCGVLICNSNSK